MLFMPFFYWFLAFFDRFLTWKYTTSVNKDIAKVATYTFSRGFTPILALITDLLATSVKSHPESE
jgi:hypothetical protein